MVNVRISFAISACLVRRNGEEERKGNEREGEKMRGKKGQSTFRLFDLTWNHLVEHEIISPLFFLSFLQTKHALRGLC